MPVKRRAAKVRDNPAEEVAAWSACFDSGRDFFESLPEIGIPIDDEQRPARATARAAWHRLGGWYLDHHRPRRFPPWALSEFGDPHAPQETNPEAPHGPGGRDGGVVDGVRLRP